MTKNFTSFKIDSNIILLSIIVFFALILRTFSLPVTPFTYDEFSALFRTHFSSFSELIEKGVKPDGHPAGIQLFLYFWTKLFGYSEIVVKLPFVVFGILSVLMIYKVAQKWFNNTVGLVCASFIATLQYTVMYSQIARPYISGLFFVLLMLYFWQRIVSNPQSKFIPNGIGYVISCVLCVYDHYFCFLLALIIGITGFFLIDKKYIKHYLLLGFFVLLAFVPYINIFIFQLKQAGVEAWLSKPHNDFIVEYIKYLFHFSPFVFSLVLGIIVLGFLMPKREKFPIKYIVIAFCWFLLPFLIGFIYSRYVNAVLQYSVLIFSFPFLLFFLFGHLPELKPKWNALLVLIILFVNTLSLFLEREHFKIFNHSFYKEVLVQSDSLKKAGSDYISIIDSDRRISNYYSNKLNLDTTYIRYSIFKNKKDFITFLKSLKEQYLYFGVVSGCDPSLVSIIQDYYPYIIWQKNYFTGNTYLFSKVKEKNQETPLFSSILDFKKPKNNWSWGIKDNWIDTFGYNDTFSYYFDSIEQWSPRFTRNLSDIIKNKNNLVDITVFAHCLDVPNDVLLVSSLESNGKNIDWRATSFESFITEKSKNGEWVKIHFTVKLSDIYLKYRNIVLSVDVWNKGKKRLFIDNFEIKIRMGNPIVYGLIEKI